jgi:uncharacterized protein (DUF1778 family)
MAARAVTIRIDERDREVLEAAARAEGLSLTAYLRMLAADRADSLRRAKIRAQGEKVVAYLQRHPAASKELELLSSPLGDLPEAAHRIKSLSQAPDHS